MEDSATTASPASPSLQATHVYIMATVCLLAGLAIGYQFRGSQSLQSATQPASYVGAPSPSGGAMRAGHMPSLEEMKRMADNQAAPLLAKLQSDPANSALLMQIGAIYHGNHQFNEAADYYDKARQANPQNVSAHTSLASSLYRSGDVDGAIAQLNQALRYDPNDANALFNLGLIRLQGKHDGNGALAAWQKLLKSNPQLSADRKAEVQKLMAGVLTMLGDQHGMRKGASQ